MTKMTPFHFFRTLFLPKKDGGHSSKLYNGVGLSCLVALIPAIAVSAQSPELLEAGDCEFIARYDERSTTPSFVDQFVYMAFEIEACPSNPNFTCEPSGLHRRESPPAFRLDLSSSSFENLEVLRENLIYVARFLYDHTGIVSEFYEGGTDDFVRILILGEGDLTDNSAQDGSITYFGLQDFQEAAHLPCVGNVNWGQDDAINFADVWIRESLPQELFAQCVKEEIYQSLGLLGDPIGDAALFDDDFGRGPSLRYPLFEPFSTRDEIMLRLLYSDELETGSDAETVRQVLSTIIARDCDIPR